MLYLLTSPELGYKKVRVEPIIGEEEYIVDLYIDDIELAIEFDGPVHFFGNTGERRAKLTDRQRERAFDMLRIRFDIFDRFLRGSSDFMAFKEQDFAEVKLQLKELIDAHLA